MVTFTVFTPTYNRANILPHAYESLCNQTYKKFEWIIVDDGSTDETEKLVESWKKISSFQIVYVKQENMGKHVAHNTAIQLAKGDFFIPLDSDDICTPNALERFKLLWETIPIDRRKEYSGVSVLTADKFGGVNGTKFPKDVIDSTPFEITTKYQMKGDKWGCKKTSILLDFPFPVFPGEKFIAEGLVWNRIGLKYKTRYANEILLKTNYLREGLSANSTCIRIQSPKGTKEYYKEYSKLPISWFWRFKALVNYSRFSIHIGETYQEIHTQLKNQTLTDIIAFSIAYMIVKRDCKHLTMRGEK